MKILCAENQFNLEGDAPDISEVQLLRAGKFQWNDNTTLEITPDMLRSMKRNFDMRVKKVDLAIDYFHASHAEAAGWIKEVALKNADSELWVKVEWTPRAEEKILSKEIRYLSVDFDPNYKDNETKIEYGATLNGGGLTNRPFVKGMNPVLSDFFARFDKNEVDPEDIFNSLIEFQNRKKGTHMNLSDLKKEIVVLNDAQKQELGDMLGFAPKDVKIAEENASLKAQLSAKDAENKKLSDKLDIQAKEAEFSVLMSEGKAVEAQKPAYLSGNMAEFLKLAVPVNLHERGSGAPKIEDKAGDPKTIEEAEAKVSKLAEERRKVDKSLSVQQSIAIVLSENAPLAKMLG